MDKIEEVLTCDVCKKTTLFFSEENNFEGSLCGDCFVKELHGRECRKETTGIFYPSKITFEEFLTILIENKEAFESNMKTLKIEEKQYVEEWARYCLAWNEIEGFNI